MISPTGRDIVLPPVRANYGIELAYRRRLDALIDEMAHSLLYWIGAAYKANEPELAKLAQDDAAPARTLSDVIRRLASRWQRRFDELAPELARWFSTSAKERSDAALRAALRKAGFTVKFRTTRAVNDVLQASIAENVGLIKSIPAQYLTQVEGLVMRSVQQGRNLGPLAAELEHQFGVTKRRAALISRDQNNKASAVIARTRQQELGITQARWVHSTAGREPRASHVKASRDRVIFDLAQGWYDPHEGKRIWPGELINCFPGDSRIQFAKGVEIAYRRRFCGYLTEIITENGKSLRFTPNHPILTSRGWIAGGLLNEGDNVIEIADDVIGPSMEKYDVNCAVPLISQIFGTLFNSSILDVRSKIALGGNFHGDIADCNVDIVGATRLLSIGTEIEQRFENFKFAGSDNTFSRFGSFYKRGKCIVSAAAGFASGMCKTFATDYAFASHAQPVGLAGRPYDAADRADASRNRMTRDAVLNGEGKYAFPRFMFPTQAARIVRVNHVTFDGHVYNLQTAGGWYAAGGIIAHNCRCTASPIIPGFN